MRSLSKKNVIWVVVLNLLIGFGFYIDNLDSGYSVLASDVHSIVPIAQKFDNPDLFKNDLFLNTLDNVRYYTPFFVQPLRFFAKFTDYNYLQALNLFGFLTHFFFGILWFLLLYKFTNKFWIALLMSVLIRGLVWLPGYEIWGITDLWSIMPRTIYISLMPLPFLFLSKSNKKLLLTSAFLIGMVFNFHPITGIGGVLVYLSLLCLVYLYHKNEITFSLSTISIVLLLILIGMLPFIITYFSKTEVIADYDIDLYKRAFDKRIPPSFESPWDYLKQWIAPKSLFFIIPLFAYFFLSFKHKAEHKKAKVLVLSSLIIILLSSSSIYIEGFVNKVFDLNLRMAFQFIRLQKLAILPAYFAMAFLLMRLSASKKILPIAFFGFFIVLMICKSPNFNGIPLAGDDIFRAILPESISFWEPKKQRFIDIDRMMEFIAENTNNDDVIVGPPVIRAAAKRSVVMDYKGASAIIEGNPKQFIQWYLDSIEYEKLTSQQERLQFLRDKKQVDYIVTTKNFNQNATLVHTENRWNLYKLDD